MDPLSITAGTIGITHFAISSISQLRSFIIDIQESKEVIQDISSTLEGIQRPLVALEDLVFLDRTTYTAAKADLEKTGLVEAVNNCGQASAKFTKNLKQWTKHSSDTKISLRDRFSVGVWNKEKIRTFRTQIQSCQATVQFAVTSTQLLVQLRSDQTTEAERERLKTQLQGLETRIEEHIELIKQQQVDAQKRQEELQEEPEDEEDGGAQRALAMQEVKKQAELLEADQISSAEVLSRIVSKRTDQDISKVITSNKSKAWVGMTEGAAGKLNQRIAEITTQNQSAAVVGTMDKNMDMSNFFSRW